jgi:asparagine synthase (glutamine-hydrolysing)
VTRPVPSFAGWIESEAGGRFEVTLTATSGVASACDRRGMLVACDGRPAFRDASLAALARREGDAAAWAELVERRGGDAFADVDGRFAVAVVDRPRRRALLAVDRFATVPLCVAQSPGRLAFATRADALPGVAPELDPQALFDYLYFHVIPAPRTVYRGVTRLTPAQRLTWTGATPAVERYWQPRFAPDGAASFPALRERFRAILEDAVRDRFVPGVTGAYLSGGTDSSTIAGMLGRVSGQPARTYSIGFDVDGYDEMAFARIAARHFGTDHHEYYVSPGDIAANVEALASRFDQPFGNSSALPGYCCARFAREDGVERLLAGDGGDELFGGNQRYATQRVYELYHALPAALRRALIEPVLRGAAPLSRVPVLRKARSYVQQAAIPLPDRLEVYNLLLRIGTTRVLDDGFLASVDPALPPREQRVTYADAGDAALIDRMLAYDWKYTLADNDLPKVVESAAMAGVEVAFPMLDERLVAFSLGLPPALKLRGFKLRWFFKEALRGFLPDEILRKRKHGFGLPFGAWTLADGRLREVAFDALAGLKGRGFVRPAFIDDLTDRLLPEHPGYYGEMVWILMMLELWLRSEPAALHERPDLRAAA